MAVKSNKTTWSNRLEIKQIPELIPGKHDPLADHIILYTVILNTSAVLVNNGAEGAVNTSKYRVS